MFFLLMVEDDFVRDKLQQLYIRYKKDLFLTAYDLLKDYHEAEDAVQSVILKLAQHLKKLKDVDSKQTRVYLIVTMRNHCLDCLRARKEAPATDQLSSLEPAKDYFASVEDYVQGIEASAEIAQSLNEINPDYADVIMLRYYHEYSIAEVAEILDISENNVSVRLHRAVNAIRKKLMERRPSHATIR